MKHLRAINRKAHLIDDFVESAKEDVVALGFQGPQQPRLGMHVPMGCSFVFTPGWEVDAAGGAGGLCQPIERDIYDCWFSGYWPAQTGWLVQLPIIRWLERTTPSAPSKEASRHFIDVASTPP
jgi:hypothetical protein